jgi:DNA-binding NarL/FixJ family response regulator
LAAAAALACLTVARYLNGSRNHRPRILLADDHVMLLEALRRLLEPGYDIVGTARDGRALLELAPQANPEVIILDIAMPRLNGIEAAAQLRHRLHRVKIIFLTMNEDPDVAAEVIRQGASGFVLKSSASAELISAIELTLSGKIYITPLITKGKPIDLFLSDAARPVADKLTARQREVLQLLAEGRSMKEAAGILKLTPRTVAFHKYSMMETLGLQTSAELVQYAVERHIVASRDGSQ